MIDYRALLKKYVQMDIEDGAMPPQYWSPPVLEQMEFTEDELAVLREIGKEIEN